MNLDFFLVKNIHIIVLVSYTIFFNLAKNTLKIFNI